MSPFPHEDKLIIPPERWDALYTAAGLASADDKKRSVWFFETPTGQMYAQHVILRARIGKKKSDTTVKQRGLPPLTDELCDLLKSGPESELKQELDRTGDEGVLAVSLKQQVERREGESKEEEEQRQKENTERLQRLVDGVGTLREALTLHQRALAALQVGVPWEELSAWGPIESTAWEVSIGGFDLGVERWKLAGETLIEVSHKSDDPNSIDALRALMAGWGVDATGLPGGKTQWALRRLGVTLGG